MEGKGIVLNGKKITDLEEMIISLAVDYKKETGVHQDSLFAYSKLEGIKTTNKVHAIEKDKFISQNSRFKKGNFSSSVVMKAPSFLENRNIDSVIGRQLMDLHSQANIMLEKKMGNLIEYLIERLPDYVEIPEIEKEGEFLTNLQTYILREFKSLNELIFDIENCLMQVKTEISGAKIQNSRNYEILGILSEEKIPEPWLRVINEDKLKLFRKIENKRRTKSKRLDYESYIKNDSLNLDSNNLFDTYLDILKVNSSYLNHLAVSFYEVKYILDLSKFQQPKNILKSIHLDFCTNRGPDVEFEDISLNYKLLNRFEIDEQIFEEVKNIF